MKILENIVLIFKKVNLTMNNVVNCIATIYLKLMKLTNNEVLMKFLEILLPSLGNVNYYVAHN